MSENIKTNSNYKTELEKNKVISFVPSGNSMWPTLKNHGQSVVVEHKKARLKVLDVAFYQRASGVFVLHRVMEVKPNGYVMCGDSQFAKEFVPENMVFGKMLGFYRKDKYIEVTDQKYLKEVTNWFKRKGYRRLRLKIFYLSLSVKARLKKIFCKKEIK